MDLLDSHDTARLLWQLTPGPATTAAKEGNAAALAEGKQRLRLASLLQFGVPGAPTIYYGDEVGMTGADDPDDRRTYPWADTGGHPDTALLAHYRALAALRKSVPALVNGDFRVLFADAADAVAYGRKTGTQAAIVALNRAGSPRTLRIDVGGYLPDGTALHAVYGAGAATVSGGVVTLEVPALAGVVLATGTIDLTPPSAPTGLAADEGNGSVVLRWNAVGGAAAYHVYRSPMTGGGYVRVNAAPVTATSFTDTGLRNARTYYYVVRALDAAGNESGDSNEVAALPHPTIGWSNLQWPPSITHTISAVDRTPNIYGQIWIDGVTSLPGPAPGLRAELGFGPSGSNPAGNTSWRWTAASFNTDVGNNDEYVASLLPDRLGTFDYAYRYSVTDGREWTYADLDGSPNGYSPEQAGKLTVVSSGDTTAPAAPTSLRVVSSSPAAIDLAWDAVTGDPTLYGYEVLRGDHAGGPYAPVELTTATSFTDADVTQGATYYYVVRSVDLSFNRSGSSGEVAATAQARTVAVVFSVTVPATTDATGRAVHVAGTLSRLDGGLPDWDPAALALGRVDATHWTITLHGPESTQIEYKYALGDWDHVEKDASCGEIENRRLTLSYGSAGTQPVDDAVPNWRNVPPCGN
jgi:fibronectin type 3 domain-containing protein